jgi:carbamoyl-phosphate synthase large subunit
MKILITSIGSNTSISIIKALRMQNMLDLVIYGTDFNSSAYCAGSLLVDFFIQLPNSKDESEYETKLISLIRNEQIDLLIPIHDTEILLISKLKFKYPNLLNWCVNDESIINLCNNKKLSNDYSITNGIKTPENYELKFIDKSTFRDNEVIAKPFNGVSSFGIHILNNYDDFQQILNKIDPSIYIFQKKVYGVEYTVDCYSNNDGCFYGGLVRERIETKSGIAVKSKVVEFPQLLNICKIFLNKINYKGASNLQFIVNENDIFFIEINPRFSGAGILSYKAGFNSPLLTILESLNQKLPDFETLQIKYNLIMNRYWEETYSYE